MTTTDLRNPQLVTATGVARVAADRRRTAGYRAATAATFATAGSVFVTTTGIDLGCGSTTGAWSAMDAKPMSKVDLHPDRWPLLSPS